MKFINLIIILLIPVSLLAQTKEWETEYSEDGKTEVTYAIYDSLNAEDEEVKFIEYTAKTRTKASIEECVKVFNNPEMHKEFYEYTEKSDKIKDVNENEWIIYYYYDPPWPIANSDCVSRITMKTDSTNKKVVFTSFSEPNFIEKKDVTRSELNDITFSFIRINDQITEILIKAILIPETPAPNWMMSAWFPDGPAGTLSRFKELAENL